MRIGVIGCGTIARAAVEGIVLDGHNITVSERNTEHASFLAETYENVQIADNQGVVDASDVLFLGLMAEVAPDVLGPLTFRTSQVAISFMAGATLEEADALIQPARATAIMMPFPGIAAGGTPIMMYGDTGIVADIFGNRNSIFPVRDPDEMAAYLCAQAVLSPVALMVSDAADWLGDRVSDKSQGEAFLRMLVASNLSTTACGPLIEALNTPGGYNQRLRLHMQTQGFTTALKSGLTGMLPTAANGSR
ncbi:NAD(P)-binding domain-containing protein [Marivita sp. XM-24bin2]|jgi:pyrroline-5-carboxylate reductase|uniref:NAD(P)-binding domain-containing protein n=1 Tax=unclassified Marivita TaxID=2632480 RepID=UPI000D7B2FF3|nr:NAD(P)-binding domain-containing protein [Marivita sp. XM-24bin2]MCR9108617.1 NAD(P)-binding domain-containing protein [Paracoccaceae bacterium]PWL36087.1 MAG: pyrroline-5-carboxylate reductase [Marivita sp. XM-24bin2]